MARKARKARAEAAGPIDIPLTDEQINEANAALQKASALASVNNVVRELVVETSRLHSVQPFATRGGKLAWLFDALNAVQDDPGQSDRQIARAVGVSPGTLSRSKTYQAGAAHARQPKVKPAAGRHIRGRDGALSVEAVAPEESLSGEPQEPVPIPGSRLFREMCRECGDSIRVPRSQVGQSPVCDACKDG